MSFEQAYEAYYETTKDPQAAALLCVAEAIRGLSESTKGLAERSLSHEICLGIRYGMFGSNAPDRSSVADTVGEIADAIKAE